MAERPVTLVRLGDGVSFDVYASYRRVRRVWGRALKSREFIEIVSPAGKSRWVNPLQIVYIAELGPDAPRGKRRRVKSRVVRPVWVPRPRLAFLSRPLRSAA